MKVAIDLSEGQAARLSSEAQKLGVSPEALLKAALVDLLDRKQTLPAQRAMYSARTKNSMRA